MARRKRENEKKEGEKRQEERKITERTRERKKGTKRKRVTSFLFLGIRETTSRNLKQQNKNHAIATADSPSPCRPEPTGC